MASPMVELPSASGPDTCEAGGINVETVPEYVRYTLAQAVYLEMVKRDQKRRTEQ